MRVVVAIDDEVTIRTAHVLAAMSGIGSVAVMGTTKSRAFPVVGDAAGADVIIGESGRTEADRLGLPLVTEKMTVRGGDVAGASPRGLALALAERVPTASLVAVTTANGPASGRGERIRFPDPIGMRSTVSTTIGSRELYIGPTEDVWSAILVEGGDKALSAIDDTRFFSAVTLACGVVLAARAPTTVWEHPGDYIAACREEGLVFAQRH